MTADKQRKKAARAEAAARGIPYAQAARELREAASTTELGPFSASVDLDGVQAGGVGKTTVEMTWALVGHLSAQLPDGEATLRRRLEAAARRPYTPIFIDSGTAPTPGYLARPVTSDDMRWAESVNRPFSSGEDDPAGRP